MDTARDLSTKLATLLRNEHQAMAEFLVALADFDRRRGWADLGHANLFSFLHRELGLSRGAAHYRKTAAELVQRFPEVVEPLRDGRLCITSVVELAKVITPENRTQVLPRFFHCSKQEAKEVAAELCPRPAPARDVVTSAAPVPRSDASRVTASVEAPVRVPTTRDAPVLASPAAPATSSAEQFNRLNAERANSPSQVEPLDRDLRRLHVTVSRRFLAKLDAARDALSHAKPGASTEEILEAALDVLLAERAKRHGQVKKPRSVAPPAPNAAAAPAASAAVPAHVKREVYQRAGGRCEWKLASGERCGSTVRLEYDHVVPRALGGPSTIGNVRLLCRAHNELAARQVFGDRLMDKFHRTDGAPFTRSE
jgi:hypothetical protein